MPQEQTRGRTDRRASPTAAGRCLFPPQIATDGHDTCGPPAEHPGITADRGRRDVDRCSPPTRAEVAPLAPERYKVQFTVGRETYEKLRKVQDLLRHRLPSGDPAAIFDRALTLLLEDLEKKKLAVTERPRAASASAKIRARHVPAEVRRTVWARDGGQCRFEGQHGRCRETAFLEFHHVVPYAAGGLTTLDNLELRCAAHNRYEAEQYFRGDADVCEGGTGSRIWLEAPQGGEHSERDVVVAALV